MVTSIGIRRISIRLEKTWMFALALNVGESPKSLMNAEFSSAPGIWADAKKLKNETAPARIIARNIVLFMTIGSNDTHSAAIHQKKS